MLSKFVIKHIAYPVAEHLKNWPLRKYLEELNESQWLTAEQIRELQNNKLANLIQHSYETVPFYRQLMDERGLEPQDIRTIDDLVKLPILTKNAIRAAFPEKMLSSKYDANKLVIMSSSGSTGEPFKYYMSQDEKARKWAGLFRFWTWSGWDIGDRYATMLGSPLRAFKNSRLGAFIEDRFSGVMSIPAFELYNNNAHACVDRLLEFNPVMLRGYASSLYYVAQIIIKRGLDVRLKAICSTGETLFDFQRESIESAFHCKVFNGYGGEGMEIANECEHSGFHVNAESVIAEVVDANGNRCAPGVLGQLVLTDLNHYSMPFIRYNIQDMASVSQEACLCGRGLPMLSNLSGRLTDVGITPSGKVIVVHFFTGMFMKLAPAVTGFQVIQERPNLFSISVVPGSGFNTVKDEVLQKTLEYVGPDVKVEMNIVKSIPVTAAGKRRLFISTCGLKAAGLSGSDR
ncbi:MAG: hypothetical protein ABFD54_11665 [Armatimonadota bacterium]|nr:hypothetical protein [bacterium]